MPTQTVTLSTFAGLMQSGDGCNLASHYAVEAENCDTTGGGLKPMTACTALPGSLPSPIGTLMRLHRRYHTAQAERDVLVAVCDNGCVYTRLLSDTVGTWAQQRTGLTDSNVDFVTYEVNPEGSDAPVDVLLFTSAADGMQCLYGNDLHVQTVTTPYKFGILARHSERIWGSGITGDPDKLVYSAPYDPFNWAQNSEIPEDGSGEIMQPSWDGDSFIALKPYGSYLLAFKKERIWRVLGTDPGSYILKEQFGGGTVCENTIAIKGDYAFMLGHSGILRYDGTDVAAYRQSAITTLMSTLNRNAVQKSCAADRDGVYCLAFPAGNSTHNNRILEHSITEGWFNVRVGVNVKSFLPVEERLLFTSDETPGRVFEMRGGGSLPLKWISGWQDLGAKNVLKSGFTVYLCVESVTELTLQLGIRTENKLKTRLVQLQPGKMKRIALNAHGRQFRLELDCDDRQAWRLMGGIQIDMELDSD